jgi:hypothetical protein
MIINRHLCGVLQLRYVIGIVLFSMLVWLEINVH